MSFFSNIFRKLSNRDVVQTKELLKLKEFEVYVESILTNDKYIARSDYFWLKEEYKDIYNTFLQLKGTGMLPTYCKTNNVNEERILKFFADYKDIINEDCSTIVEAHNEDYLVKHLQQEKGYLDGILKDVDREQKNNMLETKKCPCCGYPLQLRYKKAYGLKLWICTNEPEICDFMTNNLRGEEMSIMKCDTCTDGYLIVKEGGKDPFLGCTNFKTDKTGCNKYVTRDYYRRVIMRQNYSNGNK